MAGPFYGSTLVADDSMTSGTPWASEPMLCAIPFPSLPPQHKACSSTTVQASDDLDIDQLSEILMQCHLHEEEISGSSSTAQPHPSATATASSTSVGPWADELVHKLQSVTSVEEGRALCAQALQAYHQHQAGLCCNSGSCPYSGRLEKLQGANKVIVKALRQVSQRISDTQARARHAEEANQKLAEQLRLCQEQLKASERAKANLQSHLQLMNSSLRESAMHSHQAGPSH